MRKRFMAVSERGKVVRHYDLAWEDPDLWGAAIINGRHMPGLIADSQHHCAVGADVRMDFIADLERRVLGGQQFPKIAVAYEEHKGCDKLIEGASGKLIDCVGQALSKVFQARLAFQNFTD